MTQRPNEWIHGVYQYYGVDQNSPDKRCKCHCYYCVFSARHCGTKGGSKLCKVPDTEAQYTYYPKMDSFCHCRCSTCLMTNDHCGSSKTKCHETPRAVARRDEFDDDGNILDAAAAEREKWCMVGDDFCVFVEKVYSKCKSCGSRACEYCSVRTRRVPAIGRARICHNCLKEYALDDVVEDHMDLLEEMFGYRYHADDDFEWEAPEDLHLSREEIL